jgi:hypothetical protein
MSEYQEIFLRRQDRCFFAIVMLAYLTMAELLEIPSDEMCASTVWQRLNPDEEQWSLVSHDEVDDKEYGLAWMMYEIVSEPL